MLLGCALGVTTAVFGQNGDGAPAALGSNRDCWRDGSIELSAAQMKNRLRFKVPVMPPLLYRQMRITNPILSFAVGTDVDGNVTCIQAISGHPLFIGGAIESIKQWKFRPFKIRGQRRSFFGTLIIGLTQTKHGLKTVVLSAYKNGGG